MINNNNTLTIALEKVDFLPANRVTDDTSILTLKNLVMEPLCRRQDGRLEPALLNSWWHCEDGQHWLFEIRPDARFHDGEACRAAHILASSKGFWIRGTPSACPGPMRVTSPMWSSAPPVSTSCRCARRSLSLMCWRSFPSSISAAAT